MFVNDWTWSVRSPEEWNYVSKITVIILIILSKRYYIDSMKYGTNDNYMKNVSKLIKCWEYSLSIGTLNGIHFNFFLYYALFILTDGFL